MRMKKRILATLLAIAMAVGLLPLQTMAAAIDWPNPRQISMTIQLDSSSSAGVKLKEIDGSDEITAGGSKTYTTSYNGSVVARFEVIVPAGYSAAGTFTHWGGSLTGQQTYYTAYNNVNENGAIGSCQYTLDKNSNSGMTITILITVEPIKYSVIYDANGGSGAPADSNTYLHSNVGEGSSTVTVGAAPSREGYTFTGWKLSGATGTDGEELVLQPGDTFSVDTYWANQAVVGNIHTDDRQGKFTLVAQWTAQNAAINYQVVGAGGSVSPASETVDLGASAVPQGSTATANEGYYFVGWFTDEACTIPADSSKVSGNKLTPDTPEAGTEATYYAKFAAQGTLTLQVKDREEVYSGSQQSGEELTQNQVTDLPEGYTYTITGGSYTPASGTAVGTYTGEFDAYPTITIYDENQNDVTKQYTVTWKPGTLTITPKPVTVVLSASDKTYDGSTDATGTLSVTGVVEGDTVTASASSITFADKDAGESKNVTASGITLSGERSGSYTLVDITGQATTEATATASITPRAVTITVDAAEKFYGTEDPAFTGSITSGSLVENSDLGQITYKRTNTGTEGVGTYQGVLDAAYTANSNYSVTVVKGDFTIKTASVEGAAVTASGGSKVYDGTPFTASASVSGAEGYTVYYKTGEGEWTTTAPSVTNVAEGTVTVSVKAVREGYADLLCGDVTIAVTARPITITAASASKVYDGTALTKDSYSVNTPTEETPHAGLVSSQTIRSVTVTGSQTKIGSSDNVASAAVILSGETDVTGNYDITYQKGVLTVIGTGTITVTKTPMQTSAALGSPIVWTVTVTNNGDTEVKDLTLTDSIQGAVITAPTGVDPASFSVAAKGEVVFTVTYTPLEAGSYTNHVEVSQPKDGDTAEKVAQADSPEVSVYAPYYPSVVTPDPTVKVKGLNTTDHVAYLIGYEDGTVRPDGAITRAEVATIYFRLMTEEFRSANWSTDNRFFDVPDEAWYAMAVLTLDKAGIITDAANGLFRPNEPITRAELAAMAAQFCTVTGKIPAASFLDVPATHWAAEEIALIEYAGWIEGDQGYFRPDDNLTRAEAVTIINRMLQRGAERENMLTDMVTFADNQPGRWYYEAIQEAANAHAYTRTGTLLTGESFRGEKWTALLEATDWAALERAWVEANSK